MILKYAIALIAVGLIFVVLTLLVPVDLPGFGDDLIRWINLALDLILLNIYFVTGILSKGTVITLLGMFAFVFFIRFVVPLAIWVWRFIKGG